MEVLQAIGNIWGISVLATAVILGFLNAIRMPLPWSLREWMYGYLFLSVALATLIFGGKYGSIGVLIIAFFILIASDWLLEKMGKSEMSDSAAMRIGVVLMLILTLNGIWAGVVGEEMWVVAFFSLALPFLLGGSALYNVIKNHGTITNEERRHELENVQTTAVEQNSENSQEAREDAPLPAPDCRTRLTELRTLFEDGLISETEYNSKKQSIIDEI